MSYLMPPSVAFVASACESFGPGLLGSLNGNAVAGRGAVALVPPSLGVVEPAANAGAERVLGAWSLTTTAGFSPSRPLTTKMAGCSFVGPPTGIIATARCLPGDSV